jgi:hypothetical protein
MDNLACATSGARISCQVLIAASRGDFGLLRVAERVFGRHDLRKALLDGHRLAGWQWMVRGTSLEMSEAWNFRKLCPDFRPL